MLARMGEYVAEEHAFGGVQQRMRVQNFFQVWQHAARSIEDTAAAHVVTFLAKLGNGGAYTLPRQEL